MPPSGGRSGNTSHGPQCREVAVGPAAGADAGPDSRHWRRGERVL